jgi:hypothetical protein
VKAGRVARKAAAFTGLSREGGGCHSLHGVVTVRMLRDMRKVLNGLERITALRASGARGALDPGGIRRQRAAVF